MTNRQQKNHNDASSSNHNDASSSNPSSSAELRKERNKRYYALRKERNKQLKVGNGDVSQSSSLISSVERTLLGTLQTNITQTPQIQRQNCIQTSQTRSDENMPVTTLHSLTERVMPEISRGFYLFKKSFFLNPHMFKVVTQYSEFLRY